MKDKGNNQGGRCHPVSWKVSWIQVSNGRRSGGNEGLKEVGNQIERPSTSGLIFTQVTANVNNGNGGNRNGRNDRCTYKTFTACNPKEFDRKGGAVALTRWIEKMESVFENSGCTTNQRVRYAAIGMALLIEEFYPSKEIEKLKNEFWNHTMVGANHVAYTDRFHELAKLVPHIVTPESSRIKRYIHGLAPQIRDNKKSKTGSGFVATVPPRNDNVSTYLNKCYTSHPKNAPCKLCYNFQKPGYFVRQCWAQIRQVAPVNAVKMGQNQRACYECGGLDHLRYDCPKWKQATGPKFEFSSQFTIPIVKLLNCVALCSKNSQYSLFISCFN
ncbi:reverse transcriptase domain-containing protein [Tanacetum coccineum]